MPRRRRSQKRLAGEIRDLLRERGDTTVQEIADRLLSTEDEVTEILDSYRVEDGEVRRVGPGRGGGWLRRDSRV